MQEVEVIEIHGDYLVLRVIALQFHGYHPFDGLLHSTFPDGASLVAIELLGKLLGDGTTATCLLLTQYDTLHHSTQHGLEVDTAMLIEALVLSCHQSFYEIRRQVFVARVNTIGTAIAPSTQQDAIVREHLTGIFVDRILQLLQVGHIAYHAV